MKYLPISLALLMNWYNLSGQILLDKNRIVFNADNQFLLLSNLSDSLFTLTESEIDTADYHLRNYFKNNLSPKESAHGYADYFRQYAGLIINGQKIVYVNASCKLDDNFGKSLFSYKGGGNCYFQSKVNLSDGEIDFHFNAPK